jgi:flagellum-specific peptidoglycan hydrolase FlgJ
MIGQKTELLNKTWYDKTVWPGKSFIKETPEVYNGHKTIIKDSFRIFDTIEQSFCDFILFLLYASNYGYNGTPKYGS